MIMWFLSLLLFMWCIIFIDLQIFYYPCTPGMNPTWSWCMIFLMYWWMRFANILLRFLASMFINVMAWSFLSLLCLYLVLGLGWCLQHKTSLEVFHLVEFFVIICGGRGLALLKCSVEFSCETIWSSAFVCWEFLDYWFNFIICTIHLSRLSASSFSFGRLYFSRNLSICEYCTILASLGWIPLDYVYDFFDVFLDAICQYFVEDFSVYVHQWYWPEVFFLRCAFIWFGD